MEQKTVVDFISGQVIPATPEEIESTQVMSKMLVEDYGYPKAFIQTRPQHKVKVRPSDSQGHFPVDIVIFKSEAKLEGEIEIIVECKRKDRKDGIKQLHTYMQMTSATLGVWFNGEERRYFQKVVSKKAGVGPVEFLEIPNIPKFGERLEDIGLFKRKDLKPTHNLKSIMTAIRNHMAGNAVGATRDEAIATAMINLIFCKLYDEKYKEAEAKVDFRIGVNEPAKDAMLRINNLFELVKEKWPFIFGRNEKLAIDEESLKFAVGELQMYLILDSERDVIADAFEVFIGSSLKGDQGQFFTPRNAVRVAIQALNPQPDDVLIDPACGSGGFLIEALRHKWALLNDRAKKLRWPQKELAGEQTKAAVSTVRGIEKDTFLAKVAKSYMAIIGDGHGHIYCEDSLAEKTSWSQAAQQNVPFGTFDIVVANPPYGDDIRVKGEEKLGQYTLAGKDGKAAKNGVRPDKLFVERCYDLLKPGGKMALVLIETYFHSPSGQDVLNFLKNGKEGTSNNIQMVIDLPHNTFRPHCNAKTVIVIVQKGVPQQKTVKLCVAEQMGHNHRGEPLFRLDPVSNAFTDTVWDDLDTILNELRGEVPPEKQIYTFDVPYEEMEAASIFVPRYFWKNFDTIINQELNQLRGTDLEVRLVPIKDLISTGDLTTFDGHGSPPAHLKKAGKLPYVRVADIVSWHVYKNPMSLVPASLYDEMVRKDKVSLPRDILFVKRGSYRIGSCAMVSPHDGKMILTREILTLRANPNGPMRLSPFELLYGLTHRLAQRQVDNKVMIDTTLPNIGDRWKEIKIPILVKESERKKLISKLEESFAMSWKSEEILTEVQDRYGEVTM